MKFQKETKSQKVGHGRWYDDACGTAFALELVGERWSLLIVRELMFGGRRFTDLRAGLPGISAKVLTERLEGMEEAGIVRRRQLAPPAAAQVYELTRWGYAAETAIMELGRWAALSPDHDPTLPLSPASMMLSLRTMVDRRRIGDLAVTGLIHMGHDHFFVEVAEGAFRAERGELADPDFAFTAPLASPIAAAIYGKVAFGDLAAAGLSVTGDRTAAIRFVDLFHLPEKIT